MKKLFTEHACPPRPHNVRGAGGGTSQESFYRAWKFLALAGVAAFALPARGEPFELFMRLEQFRWEEFVDGERLLEEEGPRIGLGLRGTLHHYSRMRFDMRADGFLGRVNYDGQTFAGDPIQENTDYLGVRGELDVVLRPPAASGPRLHPRLGIGARYWLRRLAEGDTDAGGYDEGWFTLYARLGADLVWTIAPDTRFFLCFARRPALYNRTWYSILIEDEESFTLEPGRDWTWDVEAGWSTERYRFAVFYETYAFKQSDSKLFPPLEVFQPKSEGRAAGVQFGVMW